MVGELEVIAALTLAIDEYDNLVHQEYDGTSLLGEELAKVDAARETLVRLKQGRSDD